MIYFVACGQTYPLTEPLTDPAVDYVMRKFEDKSIVVVDKSDSHALGYRDDRPFFWLGDTGWELFHRLNKEEIEK